VAADAERAARTPQEAFCARLRSARERRNISLAALAESTKVTTSLFQALERGDVSRWPKGIYKRSFFRAYASAIGLQPGPAVDEFLRLFPDEKTDEKPEAPEPAAPLPAAESSEAPAALRLTLAPGLDRAALLRRVSPATIVDAGVVLVCAIALAWAAGLGAGTASAVIALAFYPQLARMLRHGAIRQRTRGHSSAPAASRRAAKRDRAARRKDAAAPAGDAAALRGDPQPM
jgi:transcriptional regulator with XRE-family HTH domain